MDTSAKSCAFLQLKSIVQYWVVPSWQQATDGAAPIDDIDAKHDLVKKGELKVSILHWHGPPLKWRLLEA